MQTKETSASPQNNANDESELCISCLKPNPPGTTFCSHCGTPLTPYAATGPFESMFAEGDFWRKAIKGIKGKPWIRVVAIALLGIVVLAILSGLMLP